MTHGGRDFLAPTLPGEISATRTRRSRMASRASNTAGVIIAGVMTAMGVFIALRLLVLGRAPVTGTTGMDLAFALFFILRGAVQYRRWRLAQERATPPAA